MRSRMRTVVVGVCLLLSGWWGAACAASGASADTVIIEPEEQDTIVTTSDRIKAERLHIKLKGEIADAALALANEWFDAPDSEMRLVRCQSDPLGYTHVRLLQYYRGIPVFGTDVTIHINADSVVYLVRGRVNHHLDVEVKPRLRQVDVIQKAKRHAISHGCLSGDCNSWASVDSAEAVRERLLPKSDINMVPRSQPELIIYNNRLVYRFLVSERGPDFADWEYYVDASSGATVHRYNTIAYYDWEWGTPPDDDGEVATVTGSKLALEVNPATGQDTVSISCWQDTGVSNDNHYFLYSPGNSASKYGPWQVYDLSQHMFPDEARCDGVSTCYSCEDDNDTDCDWEQQDTDDWGTSDRFAISVARNLQLIQEWTGDVLEQHSYDGSGSIVSAHINFAPPQQAPAYRMSDTTIVLGFATAELDDQGALDVVAHEYAHAITRCSSNLRPGNGETGALNESFSDIVSAAVELYYQPDSTEAYPGSVPGNADWLVAEDICEGSLVAVRDFRILWREEEGGDIDDILQGRATRYDGTRFNSDGLTKPFRCKQNVQSFVFYLLSEGNATLDTNDGHPYGVFSGLGINSAVRIAVRANMVYTDQFSTYQDMPRAWRLAAQDLVDMSEVPARAVAAVDSAWSAVDLEPQFRFVNPIGMSVLQVGRAGDVKVVWDKSQKTSGWDVVDLIVHHSGTGDTCFGLYADSANVCMSILDDLHMNDGTYIDANSPTGRLVIRDPEGTIHFWADKNGVVRVRGGVWNFSL